MKQILEEAKREYIEKHVSRNEYASFGAAFEAGAEWHKKQSPWISIKDKRPDINTTVYIFHRGSYFVAYLYYAMMDFWWRTDKGEEYDFLLEDDDLWMYIPEL